MAAESHAKALINSVSLCMWLVNAGSYFSGYNLLLKNVNFQSLTLLFWNRKVYRMSPDPSSLRRGVNIRLGDDMHNAVV